LETSREVDTSDRFSARLNVDEFCTLNRRAFLRVLGTSALVTTSGALLSRCVWETPLFANYPFPLGVASGEPAPDGFVIWTKIAPKPLERGSGMPKRPVEVEWTVATDERMRHVARKGVAIAHPELGHSVHVEIEGLRPARDYFYQFRIGRELSRVGRARTLPSPGAAVARLRFGVAGCQRYEDGFFTAFRHIAAEQFDFVFHYGDYIYEYRVERPGEGSLRVVRVMPGNPDECYTLDDYRHRYSLYQLDSDLQAAHASAPFVMSYDDHEVDNDWAGDTTEENTPPELFLLRRAAAFQAWYEHLPLRRAQMPRGPDLLAYRRFAVGDLLTMNVLNTRLFRSPQACAQGPRVKANCLEALDPNRTMLGNTQERWLYDEFSNSNSRWTLLAQQVPIVRIDYDPDPNVFGPDLDKWDGTTAARDRLFAAVESAKLGNLVVVTGDVHQNWAGELKKDFTDEKSATLGIEFVATSVSAASDGFDIDDNFRTLLRQNAHLKFFNGQRGYVRHIVTPELWQADFRVLDQVSRRDGLISTRKSFVVESGNSCLVNA
jgi:alkaline phosphatase D